MHNPIRLILEYIRSLDVEEEIQSKIDEENRKLARYEHIRRRMPRLIRRLERNLQSLRALIEDEE